MKSASYWEKGEERSVQPHLLLVAVYLVNVKSALPPPDTVTGLD